MLASHLGAPLAGTGVLESSVALLFLHLILYLGGREPLLAFFLLKYAEFLKPCLLFDDPVVLPVELHSRSYQEILKVSSETCIVGFLLEFQCPTLVTIVYELLWLAFKQYLKGGLLLLRDKKLFSLLFPLDLEAFPR